MADPFVYLLTSPMGACKVGFSGNPTQRVKDIEAAGHIQLKLVRIWQHKEARTIEAYALRQLKSHRISGEWLKIPESEVEVVINGIAQRIDAGEIVPSYGARRRRGVPPLDRITVAKLGSAAYLESERRRVATALALIETDWLHSEIPSRDLIKLSGLSFGTIRKHLGARPHRSYKIKSFEGYLAAASARAAQRGARRNAASKAASDKIKARWELPPEIGGRTADLIAETGFTRNTVQRWIGKRPAAQARHERNLKRKQQREQA